MRFQYEFRLDRPQGPPLVLERMDSPEETIEAAEAHVKCMLNGRGVDPKLRDLFNIGHLIGPPRYRHILVLISDETGTVLREVRAES
jgi:hypothetical protein